MGFYFLVLIGEEVFNVGVYWYVMIGWYWYEVCFFLKRNGEVDLGSGEVKGLIGEEEREKLLVWKISKNE